MNQERLKMLTQLAQLADEYPHGHPYGQILPNMDFFKMELDPCDFLWLVSQLNKEDTE